MKITIRDVAKHAGVSVGTVSRAFNGYSDINSATKENILKIADELGYAPNVNARSLSAKVAPNIGIIVSGLMESDGKDNFVLLLLQGIYKFSLLNRYEVTLYTTDTKDQNKKPYTKFCQEHNICGTILSGITTKDPYFNELVDVGIPCVLIDVHLEGKCLGCVSIDNFAASKELTEYLFANGHKKIMVIAGKKNAAVNTERIASIYTTFEQHNLKLLKNRIMYCDFNEEMAYTKVKQYILQHGKSEITAFLCLSDIMAFGVMRAIKECGYSIPHDFSIVGFDGVPMCSYVSPALTTIKQDVREIGFQSAKLLHELVQNDVHENCIYVPYELSVKQSVQSLERV